MSKLRGRLVLPFLAVVCATVTACSSDPEPPPDLRGRLQSDTGTEWAVFTDPRSLEVRFLAPVRPIDIGAGTAEEKARAFFERYRDQLHGTGKSDELRLVDTSVGDDGAVHLRFEHYLPGSQLPVFAAVTSAHFTADGSVYWMQPGFRADLAGMPLIASVTREAATKTALGHLTATCGPMDGAPEVQAVDLGVHAPEGRPATLAYRVRASVSALGCTLSDVLVDATSGAVLVTNERATSFWDTSAGTRFHLLADPRDKKTIDVAPESHLFGPKTYTLKSEVSPTVETKRYFKKNENQDFKTETLGAWDATDTYKGVAVSAHFHGFHALRFFKEAPLKGKGNKDATIVVHDNSGRTDNGLNARNVDGIVYLGDGDFLGGGKVMPAAAAFDIVAHEITHGITDKTSKLEYKDESGALNESFSDVMGASAEEWFNETRDPVNNLIIGENWTKNGKGVRSMVDPTNFSDPDHKRAEKFCSAEAARDRNNDFCEVHSNSGIPNRAFSLMTVGGTNKTSGISVAKGIGWKTARELWYETLTALRPQATFSDAALVQLTAALRRGPDVWLAVACAWLAVGVVEANGALDPRLALLVCPAPPAAAPPAPARGSGVAPASGCAGHGNAVLCDDTTPFSATVCKNGGIVGTAFCADTATHCKRTSASDPTATLDGQGQLVCE